MSSSVGRAWWFGLCCSVGCSALATAGPSLADDVSLIAEPASCIALHKGQRCFRQIVLVWRVPPGTTRHCIERLGDAAPMHCFQGESEGRLAVSYASATEQRFSLVGEADGSVLAETRVETAWVYRGSRRGTSGWRLF